MNAQSIALVTVVAGLFVLALVLFVRKQRRTKGCGSCSCGCQGCR